MAKGAADSPSGAAGPRERILTAVLELLDEGDVGAVSTRAISARADVQAPAIYRLFGDKDGLIAAAAERAYANWVARKSDQPQHDDPVEALRVGWDDAIRFGLENPAVYRATNTNHDESPAEKFGYQLLVDKLERTARAGRLRVGVQQAAAVLHATGRGVILMLIENSVEARDLGIAALAREAVITAVTADPPPQLEPSPQTAAATMQALLPETHALQDAEKQLMHLWLERIIASNLPSPAEPSRQ